MRGGAESKETKLTENVEPEAQVYLGLRVDLTLIVTFVCHSKWSMDYNYHPPHPPPVIKILPGQINTENPVISGRRVANRHSAAHSPVTSITLFNSVYRVSLVNVTAPLERTTG